MTNTHRTAKERLAEPRLTAQIDAAAELRARGERTKEVLVGLFSLDFDQITVDYDPAPIVEKSQEGCIAVSDVGDLIPPDTEGWYEDSKASVIAIIRPSRAHDGNPYRDRDELVSLCVRPDCPPYRVLKTLLDNGIDL